MFGDGEQIWEEMPMEEFKLRAAVWWMSEEFAKKVKADKSGEKDNDRLAALERRWMLLFVARKLLERAHPTGYKEKLGKYYDGNWRLGEKPIGQWFETLYKVCKQTVIYVYKQSAIKPGFVHRNWMRSDSTIHDLSTFVAEAPGGEIPTIP